jgi:succinate dehydrogenase/fumarate reductase flavoprotein subunit
MEQNTIEHGGKRYPVFETDTLIIGSGAASLACADRLDQYGKKDVIIVTSRLGGGTSFNSGSDKQTYYKLSVEGATADSPMDMAHSLFDGGAMHGDLALIESTLSLEAFYHLAAIGVPFPHNRYGAFCGYKTDHDPRKRATSAGPWTSQQMSAALLAEVKRRDIPVMEGFDALAVLASSGRAVGMIAIDRNRLDNGVYGLTLFKADNVVCGAGGPGGLYKRSVYPADQTGAIGLALEAGAEAANLTESQYGLASVKFRWNVSGTYQQVIPRYFSANPDGSDEREFLCDYFPSMGSMSSAIFLKGYQWPFDPRKIADYGSSLIDIAVYEETQVRGRRVFMDFTRNPRGVDGFAQFSFDDLSAEAYEYLEKSHALFGTPIQRLEHMNPQAVELYRQHDIDITASPLEIAVCAQHNNGGLSGDIWWESNLRHFFPIGEINGSHGVYRPGGSALNAGQTGAIRAAQRIAHAYKTPNLSRQDFIEAAAHRIEVLESRIERLQQNGARGIAPKEFCHQFQQRMSDYGAHIRNSESIERALQEAYRQLEAFAEVGGQTLEECAEALSAYQCCLAHVAYLDAIAFYIAEGGGSRGSYLVIRPSGKPVSDRLDNRWRHQMSEITDETVLYTRLGPDGAFRSSRRQRRPLPDDSFWFEQVWNEFVAEDIFDMR